LIDGAIALLWPQYRKVYREYAKILQTRNRVLRARPREMNALLEVYDRQLSDAGAKVVVTRLRYLKVIEPAFAAVFQGISDDRELPVALRYVGPDPVREAGERLADIAPALLHVMQASRGRDVARGLTEHGPHADDVAFWLGDRPARNYGSQGQLRALLLAFRIAQTQDVLAKLGHPPLLLLDDVSSELDERRNRNLFDFVFGITCQVLITTARPELLPAVEKNKLFKVVNGSISG
jgi:DNA replication and repair protein RecF